MKLLTTARDLKRRKARERQQQFVAEGIRTVEVLLQSPLSVAGILVTKSIRDDVRGEAILTRAAEKHIAVVEISESDFASAANTDTPQGDLAVVDTPEYQLQPAAIGARYLVLDALQDPGNVGAVLRSAEAFGVTAVVALPGTVDFWNAKVVRSAMGALFTLPVVWQSVEDFATFVDKNDVRCWAGDAVGVPLRAISTDQPERLALIVGNEGAGLSSDVEVLVSQRVSIPMMPRVESLNVAVATGIMLYELSRIRRSARSTALV